MLAVKDITKYYGTVQALDHVSLSVSQGEILTVVGPSGCGKTTLLRVIAGFERPDKGTVWVDERAVSTPGHCRAPRERNLSMIFQTPSLWPHLTVWEHLEFVLEGREATKGSREEEISLMLESVLLQGYERRYPHQLSGGEQQRLALARGIATKPAYLLMDEPLGSLDHLTRDELKQLIRSLREEYNTGLLYVTHTIDEALDQADRIALMNQGRIQQVGDKDEVVQSPANEFVARFLRP